MKTTCLIFMMIAYATLISGTGYAVPSSQASSNESSASAAGGENQTQRKPLQKQRDPGHISDVRHLRSHALTKASRPTQFPNNRERSAAGNVTNIRGLGSSQSGAAKGILPHNKNVSRALPVRSPVVAWAGDPPHENVRHLRPNPAVIGGTMNSSTGNPGAISGSRMNRRP